MNSYSNPKFSSRLLTGIVLVSSLTHFAQTPLDRDRAIADSAGDGWFYVLAMAGTALTIVAFIVWHRNKNSREVNQYEFQSRYEDRLTSDKSDQHGVDADKELEWFRMVKRPVAKDDEKPDHVALAAEARARRVRERALVAAKLNENADDIESMTRIFQEKMKRLQFAQLPINSFLQLTEARAFDPLPLSSDPALISAIEQANEEFEEDDAVRELALRVLAAFRTRNSVEALSQIALYDLTSNIRSKAVAVLTDFDHESVFEAILLACADPTREVRAAAARGLFRLSFDRAEAWKRLIATNDDFRIRHAARAAIESGIAVKSMDRLLHEDMRIAYEAFALIGMLLKSGETEQIFEAIEKHQDERVRFALIHVIKAVRDVPGALKLLEMTKQNRISGEVADRATDAVTAVQAVLV